MTNEQFSREYRLLDRLSQGAVVTHHAQAASGAMVMVHFLRGSEAENAAVLSMIDALDVDWHSRVLAVSDVDGAPAVVTKFILDFKSLHEWLASAAKAERPAPAASPLSAPPVAEPGEFTRMFRSNMAPAPAAPAAPAGPTLPAAPLTPAETTQSSPPPAARDATTERPLPPAAQNLPPNQPGEFTLLFGGMSAVGPRVNPTAAPQTTPPTHRAEPPAAPIARTPNFPPVVPPQPVEAPPPRPSPPSARPFAEPPIQRSAEPGDFTRLFGNPTLPSSNPAPPTPYLSQSPRPPQPLPPAPTPPPVPPSWENLSFGNAASSKPTNSSPGEYTRLFGTPSPTPPSSPPAFGPTGSAPSAPSGLNWGSSNGGLPGAPSSDDAYLARLNGAPSAGRAPDASPFAQAPPPPLPVHAGPSEFTRIISAPSPIFVPTPPAPRAATPPPAPQAAQRNDRVLLFSLAGVVVVALILVVVFVLMS